MAKTALISVYDKTGVVEFAKELSALGISIISTSGTASLLEKNGIKVIQVSDLTGHKEILGGRVKTLHPAVFGGILAVRSSKGHMKELQENRLQAIDIVAVNLYPFEELLNKKAPVKELIENIDIGGPGMIRAAAKNYNDVMVVVDPVDYPLIIEKLRNGKKNEIFNCSLAAKAFAYTSRYDSLVNSFFNGLNGINFPEILNLSFRKSQNLRYGENPHQQAAFYTYFTNESCVGTAKQLHGKELSFNNILDVDSAFELVKDFEKPTAAVIKHTNPSGVASADRIEDAYRKAHETDPLSAFGCIIALNRGCNLQAAKLMKPLFIEAVICPSFDKDALELLRTKKDIRLLETGPIIKSSGSFEYKKVNGGLLFQAGSHIIIKEKDMKVVTKRKPSKGEISDMVFAWIVNKHVKSNSVVFAKDNVTVGIGAGQMSRVDAVKIAVEKSKGRCKGSVMSSDAFFPFRDGVDEAAKAGITAIVQPGGSIRDNEVIQAADEHNIAMVFTGVRLFRH
ncbi:bifunctional phosphoribosylaminoimidazolecarboxamide formyltransferase/IMP cyclohydrolase [Candidatus Woesearchaeota archaeon]|nr:bifunctional phosphoribosylaminoimidazolecarboxamide formyltransferase/IMP cyclohydrolase [Candidatus Woesearchaeota archaeon]